MIIGLRPDPYTIAVLLHANLLPKSIALSLAASAAFFSIGVPAVLGWGRAPREIRRCTVILLLFVPAILLFGLWWEVRH